MKHPVYRVILRATPQGTWRVIYVAGRDTLFDIPYRKEDAAVYMAAKLVDELLKRRREFFWSVQDEKGNIVQSKNLLSIAQRWRVRTTS